MLAFGFVLTHHRAMRAQRDILLALLLCTWGSSTVAAVHNEYPFAAVDDYLAPAQAFSSWAGVLEKHTRQHPQLLACADEPKACRGRLRSYHRMFEKAAALTDEEQISLTHFYINRVKYDDDHPQRLYDDHGKKVGVQRNHFSTLYDFLVGGGDCEDYASAKYFMLRELGFPAQDMRIVVTYERKLRGYHAVLAMRRPDGAIWLLDSDNMIRKRSHRGYRYVYAMNEHSVWDHREDYDGGHEERTTKVVSSALQSEDTAGSFDP